MKTTLLSLLALFVACSAGAQPGLSPRTRIFLDRYQETQAFQTGYIYRRDASGATVMPALLMINNSAAAADLEALGVRIDTRAGAVWTVGIPPARLAQVATLKSLKYLELDEPLIANMDSARSTTRVDSVHAGWGLPKGFSGAGVVVGVLDVGFDYTHPAFWDTSGSRYRIRRVWEQKATTGTAPAAFGYGRELADSSSIQAAGSDNTEQSHGSHVAGIALGSGRGAGDTTNRRYRGMAYGSDIVLVGITPPQSDWLSTGMTDIINGMKYVYDYAASVGKPAVVNLSWGCTIGSHDGRSLFSQACNALTGPGKLFVLSAGNNGDNNLHLQKVFAGPDTSVHSFINFPVTPIGRRSWFDVWGDSAQQLSVQLSLYNGASKTDSSAWIPLGTALYNILLRGAGGDTLLATVSTGVASFNNKPRILLDLESRTADRLCVSIRGTSGTVHGWLGYVYKSSGYYGDLSNGGLPWATSGNNTHLAGDMAATRSGIAVGAYASKNIFYNLAAVLQDYRGYVTRGRLVPFSSRGPATDGRIKPDITGPGLFLFSSINSFDTSFNPSGNSRANVVTEWTKPGQPGRPYRYAALTGTSMSSPAVAGITALLLEAAPGLTPDSLRNLLAMTAIVEPFMGAVPNPNWGAGKVNAYGALQRLMSSLGVSEVLKNPASLEVLIYPNPTTGHVSLEHRSERGGIAQIRVSDAAGRTLRVERWALAPGANTRQMDWQGLGSGLFFIKLTTTDGSALLKVVVR